MSLLRSRLVSSCQQSCRTKVTRVTSDYPYYHKLTVTKPFNRIPRWEIYFWQSFIAFAMLSGPAWIMYHHREYMGIAPLGEEDE